MSELHVPHARHAAAGDNAAVHHEESDVNIRAILWVAAGMVGVSVVIFFAVWVLFTYFNSRESAKVEAEYPLAVSQGERLPPQPRLQTEPREDLREMRAAEDV